MTMSEMFKGYFNYSKDEYNRIWKDALIVVDTNILLNFYRCSADNRKILFDILEKIKKRLWIPYQVAKEFFNNKDLVIINSYNEYDVLISKIEGQFNQVLNEINKRKNKNLKYKLEITEIVNTSFKNIERLLNDEKKGKKLNFANNEIEKFIFSLFDFSVGEPFTDEEYKKVKREGLKRFDKKIPPGYKDIKKEENGDYYIFYSLIKKSKEEKKDIIFITDDLKDDWFNKINGEKHGGRYELLNEFYKETGKLLMIYTSDGFIENYNKNINKDIEANNIINKLVEIINNTKNISTGNNNLEFYINSCVDNLVSSNDNNYIEEKLLFFLDKLDLNFNYKFHLKKVIKRNCEIYVLNCERILKIIYKMIFFNGIQLINK